MNRLRIAILAVFVGAAPVNAQGEQEPSEDPAARLRTVAEAWLESDQVSRSELEKVVAAVFVDRKAGLQWLSAQLPPALEKPNEPRSKGVVTLATHVVLEFVEREQKSDWRFAGQYAPLAALDPLASEQLFRFLIDTPEWYPHTHRAQLVPALRDLQSSRPGAERLAAVEAIAKNDALEPIGLRRALAGLLWQWGEKECAQHWLDELRSACVEGDAEERVVAMLELAEFQYVLRDYASSAGTHRALQSMAKAAGVALKPVDHYAAACVLNLCGKTELAFAQLEISLQMSGAADTDSSHRLSRELFEKDPEIATLRADPRFTELLDRNLPKKKGSADQAKR